MISVAGNPSAQNTFLLQVVHKPQGSTMRDRINQYSRIMLKTKTSCFRLRIIRDIIIKTKYNTGNINPYFNITGIIHAKGMVRTISWDYHDNYNVEKRRISGIYEQ